MSSFFSAVAATLVTVPLLGYLIVFIISKQITGSHKKSVRIALDCSTFLLILSVHFLILAIWERSYLWIIVLFMLFAAVIFTVIHWKIKQEINFQLIFKGFWRFNFLLFFSAYIVLLILGVFQSVSGYLSIP
ncbi:DUF3397 domain-containing protein [Bacillus infantis]|uniref:DUF3397 domain-containing protein n=1 Tax=Bacillus infantis TaxID=324767 RepID=UPI001CD46C8E|nr:DUF3397 domain-containing protein [Bacillus infantis]MCA1041085.1 DUF3397 domain-containing protein [Bacillus infantis]